MDKSPETYKPPILTQIYQIIGALCVVLSLGVFVVSLSRNSQGGAFISLFSGIGIALICFGIAQVVNYIGQTAHNTGQIVELLRRDAAADHASQEPRVEHAPFVRTEPSLRRTIAPKSV